MSAEQQSRTRHGQLMEAAHVAGYTFERALRHMEWLLTDGRWMDLGFKEVNEFYASVKLENLRMLAEQRKKLVKLMKEQEGASQRQIARTLGVDHKTVQRDVGANAPAVVDNRHDNDGSEPMVGANAPPDLSGHEAAKAVEDAKRKQVLAEERKAEREARKKTKAAKTGSGVTLGDFREIKWTPESADLIFTDPPYHDDAKELYVALAEMAADVLVDGGSLMCYLAHRFVGSVVAEMERHLKLWWCCSLCYSGSPRISQQKAIGVRVKWKPLLWMTKGNRLDASRFFDDHIAPPRFEKGGVVIRGKADWQQPEYDALYFIEYLCRSGNLVIDPMCGSGTTLVAAKKLGRRWLGSDIDPVCVNEARKLLNGDA